jgi:hypothetical protein
MNFTSIRNTAIALAAGAAVAAVAQVRLPDADARPDPPGKVVSDARPLPAEERDSHGAIKLHDQPVRAQAQAKAAAAAGERTGVTGVVGGRIQQIVERSRSWDAVREADADDTRRMGGPR